MSAFRSLLALTAILVLASPLPMAGEAPKEIQQLMKRLEGTEGKAFRVSYTAEMSMEQFGQAMSVKMSGKTTQAGSDRQRSTVSMSMEGMPGMPGPMEMEVLTVSDGETMWIDQSNAMMGRQVMKISIEKAKALGKLGGAANPGGGAGTDPLSQLRNALESYDMQVIDRADGKITVQADISEASKKVDGMPQVEGADTLTLVLDEKTGFPTEMRIGEEKPVLVVRFAEFTVLDSVEPQTFVFDAGGANVMDLGAMMDGMGGAGGR